MRKWLLMPALILAGCGYHFEGGGSSEKLTSISIPYISQDPEGHLNSELAQALSASGVFDYTQSSGALILQAAIISDDEERIGFRYDRDPASGSLRDNVVGTENRRALSVEIKLVEAYTDKVVFGPEVIRVVADYDYVDGNSIRDLTFVEGGKAQTVINFSLGQLDSVGGAHDDVSRRLYKLAAQKITQRLILRQL